MGFADFERIAHGWTRERRVGQIGFIVSWHFVAAFDVIGQHFSNKFDTLQSHTHGSVN